MPKRAKLRKRRRRKKSRTRSLKTIIPKMDGRVNLVSKKMAEQLEKRGHHSNVANTLCSH